MPSAPQTNTINGLGVTSPDLLQLTKPPNAPQAQATADFNHPRVTRPNFESTMPPGAPQMNTANHPGATTPDLPQVSPPNLPALSLPPSTPQMSTTMSLPQSTTPTSAPQTSALTNPPGAAVPDVNQSAATIPPSNPQTRAANSSPLTIKLAVPQTGKGKGGRGKATKKDLQPAKPGTKLTGKYVLMAPSFFV